jgi:O-methyltransferase/8-demethyl-8-(2,3-dimethoxy-alpha-L-rhamnosyl)tetracenomycin-C 4'-O-methyltransferase
MNPVSANADLDAVDRLKSFVAKRDFESAIAAFNHVEPGHPRYEGARLLLAETLLPVKPDIAARLLAEAVERNPRSTKALQLSARAYAAQGDMENLAAVYSKQFAIRPDDAGLAAHFVATLTKLGRDTDAEAVACEHRMLIAADIGNLPLWDEAETRGGIAFDPARDLYLNLLEKTVANWIYGDNFIVGGKIEDFDPERRGLGKDIPVEAHSMIGLRRLRNLRILAETVLAENIPGDFLEAGVWRGGACILLRGVLKAWNDRARRVWVADSFAGLPPPDARYPKDALSEFDFHTRPELSVGLEAVKQNFSRYDLLDDQVMFVKGLFRDTLPGLKPITLSILRLDGDLYSSTMDTLIHLYDRVSPGGFIVADDYGVVIDARRAVIDFRNARGISEPMIAIDKDGVFWRKPA